MTVRKVVKSVIVDRNVGGDCVLRMSCGYGCDMNERVNGVKWYVILR